MTLVLTCVTSEFAIQVSDKRLTTTPTGAVVDDDRNKGIQYYNQMAFAYSGLARIENKPTDEWFVETLQGYEDLERGLEFAVLRLNTVFSRLPIRRDFKRHAFVGAGWAQLREDVPVSPLVLTVTNALRPDGSWDSDASEVFSIFGQTLKDGECFRLFCLGATVHSSLRRRTERNIRVALRHGCGPNTIIRLLATTIRAVATKDRTVGRTLLAMVVPKRGSDTNALTIFGPPTPFSSTIEHPVFYHLAADSDHLNYTTPLGVGPNGFLVLGGRFSPFGNS